MQETSDWPTYHWNVMSEQRKSNWQHPNTYYREREETPGTDECDTSQHPHPNRALPTKAVQIMADPSRDVILEAVHFLVEIRNPRHPRLTSIHSIRSYDRHAAPRPTAIEMRPLQLWRRRQISAIDGPSLGRRDILLGLIPIALKD
jgi:hypothetical protein